MRNIKLLTILLILFAFIYLLHFGMQIMFFDFYSEHYSFYENNLVLGMSEHYINLFISILHFITTSLLIWGFVEIINKSYYNSTSSRVFKFASITLIFSSMINLISISIISGSEKIDDRYLSSIGLSFLLILVSLGLYIISEILKNGLQLKSENDLTI